MIDLERVPLATGATVDDLGFGEDYELLAAVEKPGGLRVIDVQTGHTRTVVSRVGCSSAALMAISRDGGLLGFSWISLQAYSTNKPLMLVGLDGSELRTVTAVPVPDVAGGRAKWEDVRAVYLP